MKKTSQLVATFSKWKRRIFGHWIMEISKNTYTIKNHYNSITDIVDSGELKTGQIILYPKGCRKLITIILDK